MSDVPVLRVDIESWWVRIKPKNDPTQTYYRVGTITNMLNTACICPVNNFSIGPPKLFCLQHEMMFEPNGKCPSCDGASQPETGRGVTNLLHP
jgi:hypothetical protein